MADFKVTQIDESIDFNSLPWWDVVIIGAGPAGLAAGLTTAHRALTTLVIEAKDLPGGQPQFLYADKKIVDVPGFPDGISGQELSDRTFRQAADAHVQFRFNEELKTIEDTDQVVEGDSLKRVITSNGSYLCRKVILACGLLHYPRRHAVLDALNSDAVHYRSPRVKDYAEATVVVVGGGDSALDAAVMALQRGARVEVIVRAEAPIGKADTLNHVLELGGVVHTSSEITAATLEDGIIRAVLNNGTQIDCEHAVIQIGFLSAKDTFEGLKLKLKDDGAIAIDPYFETSRRGIFAVGDVHGDIKLIVVAWADGIQAAIHAFREITSPYWLNEKRLHDNKLALIAERLSEAAVQKRD
jgi:ferredoxin/flavodoxin---NADP+ reductase